MIQLNISKWVRTWVLAGCVISGLVVVATLETYLPHKSAIWALFVPLISMTFFLQRPLLPIITAGFCSLWMFLDFFYIESQPISSMSFVRRTIGSIAFFSMAFIVRFTIQIAQKEKNARQALKKASLELAKEKSKLERSNLELEQFAGVAAHDLRSPIKVILSAVELLNLELPNHKKGEILEAMDIIQRNAKRADDLVEDVLKIARVNVSAIHDTKVDLNQTIKEVLEVLEKEIQVKQGLVHFSSLPAVHGNRTYLHSIFSNLIRNSLNYRDKSRNPIIHIGHVERADIFEFFVKDNGIGIDPQHSHRVFEMFTRLHREDECLGTGIGLAFCKKVVEIYGGKIWVESNPGQGSTFFFTYPKHDQKNQLLEHQIHGNSVIALRR